MERAKFEFETGDDGKAYWHLRAAGATTENEIIATGEGYSSKAHAEEGVEAVKRGVLSAMGIDPSLRLGTIESVVTRDEKGVADVSFDSKQWVSVDSEAVEALPVIA